MSILSDFKKIKRYVKESSGYKLISQWVSSQTVEMDSGKTLQEEIDKKIDNTTVATISKLGLVKSGTDIDIDSDGNVSVKDNSHKHTVNNISDLTATADELNYTDGVTSNIQDQLDDKAPIKNPVLTGTPKAPTAPAGTNTTQIATTAFVQAAVGGVTAASDAMIIKGTIGTNGTITSLPTTYKTGWTYRVVTDGTYAGQVCEIGDLIIALIDRDNANNQNSDWCVAQTNINGAITGIKNGDSYIDCTQTGSSVSISHKDVARTDTSVNSTLSSGDNFTAIKAITSDSKGHITDVETENITMPSSTRVKGENENTYRDGDVNITKENIGLGNVGNYKSVSTLENQGLTVDEKRYARDNIGAISVDDFKSIVYYDTYEEFQADLDSDNIDNETLICIKEKTIDGF